MNRYNCFIRQHSKQHIELKTQYPLFDDVSNPVFDMDFYFFFPAQLHINKNDIGVNRFLDSVQIYTRFSSPEFPLDRLIEPGCSLSPVNRIKVLISQMHEKKSSEKDSLHYELQILTNIIRGEIRGVINILQQEIYRKSPQNICQKRIEHLIKDIRIFLKEFRNLHPLFMNHHLTDQQRNAMNWADESISIIIERNMNRLFSFCGMMEDPKEIRSKIEKLIIDETEYRKKTGYQYIYLEDDSRSGERMAYRESVLKKWSQSAMYMNNETSSTPRRVGHMLAGAAAAVAMVFAVLVTIAAGKIFVPNSTPWVLLVVMSYVFKDRIKEVLRDVFGRLLPRLAADQLTVLIDPAVGSQVGVSKGTCSFLKAGMVPERLLNLRHQQPNPLRAILQEQDVIHYKRVISLNQNKLLKNHKRLKGITEIIRIRIEDWLREMDDPKDVFYRVSDGKKLKIKGNRVYIIHLLISLKEQSQKNFEELYHYRIVLNKSGLLRIELQNP